MQNLFDSYSLSDTAHDELREPDGALRAPWQTVSQLLKGQGEDLIQARHEQVSRLIQENGVTYNVYGDPAGINRPWRLDPLPNLVPEAEWTALAEGIGQRARLLDHMLRDIYGPQQLLTSGLLPPQLIYGHNNFLWPCVGVEPIGGTFLHIYAADVARGPDGRWWVMADRTQTPSGMGYALENRHIMMRANAQLYRQMRVQSLSVAFDALHQSLSQLAPSGSEPPLIVLLSAGRFNETYFEHVYLARQLGMPLVEGNDLTVRQANVYLKTLTGLRRVHAILRRLDDDYCDPLELRSESMLGVPGLLEAVRAGSVVLANALGTGVLESPGLHGFLPRIAEQLFGEPLRLPSVASWWCGESPVMADALKKLDNLVIKAAYPSQRFEPVFARQLTGEGRQALRQRIRARPAAYVAQERMRLARAPVWHPEKKTFLAHASAMRVYAIATAQGYVVLPGGLTRVSSEPTAEVVSMQRGGISKDTWICFSDLRRAEDAVRRVMGTKDLVRQDPYLPSRVAENTYWLGRYAERCENFARLMRSFLTRYLEQGGRGGETTADMDLSLITCQHFGLFDRKTDWDELRVLDGICESRNSGSMVSQLRALIYTASQVRGRLSQENWVAISELQHEADHLQPDMEMAGALSFLDRLLMSQSALAGFALDNMTQDNAWRFLMIGRRIERVQFLAQVGRQLLTHSGATGRACLGWALEVADSTLTYRNRYLSSAQLLPVLDLLLLDPANPHAIIFQLEALTVTLRQVGDQDDYGLATMAETLRSLDLGVLESEIGHESRLRRALKMLAELLGKISTQAGKLSDELTLRYFALSETVSQPTASA